MQPLLEMVEQQRFNRIKEETTKAAIEKVKVKMQQDLGEFFDSIFHYFSHYRNLFIPLTLVSCNVTELNL